MNTPALKNPSHRLTSSLLTAIAGSLLSATLSVAQADSDPDAPPAMVVKYGDLDISTDAGARALYERLARAARQVCPLADSHNLSAALQIDLCRAQAVAHAVRDINSPKLAALTAERLNRG